MTAPVGWVKYDLDQHRTIFKTCEFLGARPVTWTDKAPKPVYSREVVERMARELGWTPPIDQQAQALEQLAKYPLGVDFGTLCQITGRTARTAKAIVQPLRLAGKVRIYPRKGPGAVWYAVEHEATVIAAAEEMRAANRRAEKEAAKRRGKARKAKVNSVFNLAEETG